MPWPGASDPLPPTKKAPLLVAAMPSFQDGQESRITKASDAKVDLHFWDPSDASSIKESIFQAENRVHYNSRTDFTDPASLKDQSMGLFSVKKMIELAGLKPISLNRRRTSL